MVSMAKTAHRKLGATDDVRGAESALADQVEGFDRDELLRLAEASTTRWSDLLDRLAK